MNHKQHNHTKKEQYTLRDFLPLIGMFALVVLFTLVRQYWAGQWNWVEAMSDFMAAFFILFGTLKVFNWHGFVTAYRTYDIIAKRSQLYAYAYPLIELALGFAYLVRWNPFVTNLVTLVVMLISAIGVAQAMRQKDAIVCACLGDLFRIPLTWVTLIEDLLMAGMALAMLVIY